MEMEVIANGFSYESCVKNEYLRFEIMVITKCSPVTSHHSFVWRNLLPIFSMWEIGVVHG
jgi:hypothetical protein